MELIDSIEHNKFEFYFSRGKGGTKYHENSKNMNCEIFSLLVTEMLKYDEIMPKPVILCIIH